MIWHKTDAADAGFQRAASLSVYTMESSEPRSRWKYEYKVMHYRFASEFIYSPAKVGNVSQPNQCGRVHLCPPNHLLMATINCLPTASATSTVAIKVNRHILYCGIKVL